MHKSGQQVINPPQSEEINQRSQMEKLFWRNYILNGIEGGFYIGGLAYLSADVIMPVMINSLGGSTWMVAMMPVLMAIGFMTPPLLTAHLVEQLHRVKPFVMTMGLIQRLPFLGASLALFFLADDHPRLVLYFVFFCPFLSGLFGGLAMTAWMELVSKIIPPNRRSSSSALRNIIAAILGLIAGKVVESILSDYPGTYGYAILHLIAFGFLACSYVFFCFIKEPDDLPPKKVPRRSFLENLRSMPALLKTDRRLGRFAMVISLMSGLFIMTPFLGIHVLETTNKEESFLGVLVMTQMAGGIFGNILAGFLGDRYGGKIVLIIAQVMFLVVCTGAVINTSVFGFGVIYFLYGLSFFLYMVGRMTLNLEICGPQRRPTFVAMISSLNCIFMFSAAGIASIVSKYTTGISKAALLTASMITVAIFFLGRVKEPRVEKSLVE